MTPPRMVELQCPVCEGQHWVIDSDFRGTSRHDVPNEEREYVYSKCAHRGIGHRVLQKSPPEFLLHPPFRSHLAVMPWCFAITSPPSGCEEGLHVQAVEHARHTRKSPTGNRWDFCDSGLFPIGCRRPPFVRGGQDCTVWRSLSC